MTLRETWWVAEDALDVLDAAGLSSVPACMEIAASGIVLSSDRQSAAVRLATEPPLLLKWRRPRPGRRWRTLFRASRERREARAALLLARLGLPTVAPLAVGERRSGPRLVGSVLVRPYLQGVVTAAAWIEASAGGEHEAMLARALARWHDAGFRHGDCYPKNVLVDPGTQEAVPIGAPYAHRTAPGRRLDRRRRKDLAQWAAGLSAIDGDAPSDPLRFLADYAEAAGLAPSIGARIRPHLERIQARKTVRRATQPHREPGGAPAPTPLPRPLGPVPRRIHLLAEA